MHTDRKIQLHSCCTWKWPSTSIRDAVGRHINSVNINKRPKWFGKGCTGWPRVTDRLTDLLPTNSAHIGNNSQHLMHSMQPKNWILLIIQHTRKFLQIPQYQMQQLSNSRHQIPHNTSDKEKRRKNMWNSRVKTSYLILTLESGI